MIPQPNQDDCDDRADYQYRLPERPIVKLLIQENNEGQNNSVIKKNENLYGKENNIQSDVIMSSGCIYEDVRVTWRGVNNFISTLPINKNTQTHSRVGFKNMGNTCFMNACIQALEFTPAIYSFCHQQLHSRSCHRRATNNWCAACNWERAVQIGWSSPVSKQHYHNLNNDTTMPKVSSTVKSNTSIVSPLWRGFCSTSGGSVLHKRGFRYYGPQKNYRQHCAHDFLCAFRETVKWHCLNQDYDKFFTSTLSDNSNIQGGSLLRNRFQSLLKESDEVYKKESFSYILSAPGVEVKQCLTCKKKEIAELDHIEVYIASLNSSTKGGIAGEIDSFFSKHMLGNGAIVNCDFCKNKVKKTRHVSLTRYPCFLTVVLSRNLSKHDKKLPLRIPVSNYLLDNNNSNNTVNNKPDITTKKKKKGCTSNFNDNTKDNRVPLYYSLNSIVIHEGRSVDSGHYYTFARNGNNGWMRCDDAIICPIGPEGSDGTPPQLVCRKMERGGYIFFYTPEFEIGTSNREMLKNGNSFRTTTANDNNSNPNQYITNPCTSGGFNLSISRITREEKFELKDTFHNMYDNNGNGQTISKQSENQKSSLEYVLSKSTRKPVPKKKLQNKVVCRSSSSPTVPLSCNRISEKWSNSSLSDDDDDDNIDQVGQNYSIVSGDDDISHYDDNNLVDDLKLKKKNEKPDESINNNNNNGTGAIINKNNNNNNLLMIRDEYDVMLDIGKLKKIKDKAKKKWLYTKTHSQLQFDQRIKRMKRKRNENKSSSNTIYKKRKRKYKESKPK